MELKVRPDAHSGHSMVARQHLGSLKQCVDIEQVVHDQSTHEPHVLLPASRQLRDGQVVGLEEARARRLVRLQIPTDEPARQPSGSAAVSMWIPSA